MSATSNCNICGKSNNSFFKIKTEGLEWDDRIYKWVYGIPCYLKTEEYLCDNCVRVLIGHNTVVYID